MADATPYLTESVSTVAKVKLRGPPRGPLRGPLVSPKRPVPGGLTCTGNLSKIAISNARRRESLAVSQTEARQSSTAPLDLAPRPQIAREESRTQPGRNTRERALGAGVARLMDEDVDYEDYNDAMYFEDEKEGEESHSDRAASWSHASGKEDEEYLLEEDDLDAGASEASSGEFEVVSDANAKRKWTDVQDEDCSARIRELETENAFLRKENLWLKKELAAVHTAGRNPLQLSAPVPPTGVGILLTLVAGGHDGKALHEVEPPFRFSNVGAFPHAVVTCEGTRQYQLEARRPCTLAYALVNADGSPASENDLPLPNMLFKLSIHYADDGTEVKARDVAHSRSVDALVSPGSVLAYPRMITNGCISLKLHFTFSSAMTCPRNRLVFVRMQPADEALQNNARLRCDSFAFLVRAKVTARRA